MGVSCEISEGVDRQKEVEAPIGFLVYGPIVTLYKGGAILRSVEIFAQFKPSDSSEVKEMRESVHYDPLNKNDQLIIFGDIFDRKIHELRQVLREGGRLCHFEFKIVYVNHANYPFTINLQANPQQ